MKQKVKQYLPNMLTGCRIIISLILIHRPVLSSGFYTCYFMAGITDMIDGMIARKLGTDSEFGEKIDTIADVVFVVVALCKFLPAFEISIEIWIWIGVIAGIKVINIISGLVLQKKIVAVHSWANKITGFALFALPFSLKVIDIRYSAIVVCLLTTFAAIQEGHVIRTERLK